MASKQRATRRSKRPSRTPVKRSSKTPAAIKRAAKPRPKAKRGRSPTKRQRLRVWKHPDRLELALRYMREGGSLKSSAERAFVSRSEFRDYLRKYRLATWRRRRWKITDRRQREITIISEGQERQIKVRGFNPASLAMRHRAAVKQFLASNDVALLAPFEGQAVTDTAKQKYVLETRPNVLLRLANAGSDAEMKIYRLID